MSCPAKLNNIINDNDTTPSHLPYVRRFAIPQMETENRNANPRINKIGIINSNARPLDRLPNIATNCIKASAKNSRAGIEISI